MQLQKAKYKKIALSRLGSSKAKPISEADWSQFTSSIFCVFCLLLKCCTETLRDPCFSADKGSAQTIYPGGTGQRH